MNCPSAEQGVERLAYSVAEVAAGVGLSVQSIYREIAEGRLRAKRIRGRVIVPAEGLAEWLGADQ